MLVLSRKIGERIVINDQITVEVLQIVGNRVRLGVTAPVGCPILREELLGPPKIVEKKEPVLETAGASLNGVATTTIQLPSTTRAVPSARDPAQ